MSKGTLQRVVLCLALVWLPACLVRRREVTQPPARQISPLLAATKDQLVARLHAFYDPVQSITMRVNLSPSLIDRSKGVATDYATVSAYILFQKPENIRILGRDPLVGVTLFDMVSTGEQFRVSIPPKSRFLVGNNDAPGTSANKLENLRPTAFLTSLIVHPPEPEEMAILENDTERALYILLMIRRNQGDFVLARQVYFDGRTLQVTNQKTFDDSGNILSDTKYSDWRNNGGITFPCQIDIQRPKDNYEVQISIVNLKFNTPDVNAEKFILNQPPDTRREELK